MITVGSMSTKHFQISTIINTVLLPRATWTSLSKPKENADADELRPAPEPQLCALRCSLIQDAEIGRIARPQMRSRVFSKPISLIPPSGFGSLPWNRHRPVKGPSQVTLARREQQ
eukprot:8685815-Pyramimonas_sp.AAC.1